MKKIIAISCLILMMSGCNGRTEKDEPQKTVLLPTKPEIAVVDNVQKPAHPAVEVQQGWYRVWRDGREVERCFDFSGCVDGTRRVLPGVIKRSDGLFCGTSANVDYVEGYRCDPKRGHAVCSDETCKCGDTEVLRDEICDGTVNGGAFAADSERFIPIDDAKSTDDGVDALLKSLADGVRTCGEARVVKDDGTYREFSCLNIQTVRYDGDGDYGYWYCTNPKGCRTPDGRIYNALSRINPLAIDDPYEFCMYHLVGKEDTTVETLCESGDCVFPEEIDPNQRLATIQAFTKWLPDGFVAKCAKSDAVNPCKMNRKPLQNGYDVEGFVIDTLSCEGGARYCHGRNNKPMKAPGNPDGYVCRQQYQLPATPVFFDKSQNALRAWTCNRDFCECGGKRCPQNAVCMDEKCFCGDKHVEPSFDYACDSLVLDDAKTVEVIQRCMGENCPCGIEACARNEVCVDGLCLCRDKVKPSDSAWRCEESGNSYNKAVWRCNDPKGCVCGDRKCPKNAQCVDGVCTCRNGIDVQPGEAYACESEFWVCKDKSCPCYGGTASKGDRCPAPYCRQNQTISVDGCMCGEKPALPVYDYECMKSEQFGFVNVAKEDKVLCGTAKCDEGMYCMNAKCVAPDISDGLAAHRYWTSRVIAGSENARICDKPDGCFCGSEKCVQNYYCIDGHCAAAEYSFEREGHRFSFSLERDEEYDDNEEYIVERAIFDRWRACGAMQELEYSVQEARRFDEVYPIDYAHSDRIDDYMCVLTSASTEGDDEDEGSDDGNDGEYGEDIEDEWQSGMILEQYSAKGLVCPKDVCMCGDAQCPASSQCQCRYELETHQIRCSCVAVGCGDSEMSESTGYECISGLGLVCREEMCKCGEVPCARGSVCLSDGVCTPMVIRL